MHFKLSFINCGLVCDKSVICDKLVIYEPPSCYTYVYIICVWVCAHVCIYVCNYLMLLYDFFFWTTFSCVQSSLFLYRKFVYRFNVYFVELRVQHHHMPAQLQNVLAASRIEPLAL